MKTFPTEVVVSLASKYLLCDFVEMKALAGYMLGGEIFDLTLLLVHSKLQQAIYQQHPDLLRVDTSSVTTENWQAFVKSLISEYGPTRDIQPLV